MICLIFIYSFHVILFDYYPSRSIFSRLPVFGVIARLADQNKPKVYTGGTASLGQGQALGVFWVSQARA